MKCKIFISRGQDIEKEINDFLETDIEAVELIYIVDRNVEKSIKRPPSVCNVITYGNSIAIFYC